VVSLNIEDSPVGYVPPVGPRVRLHLTYNQREAGQPAVFSYSNLGPKWTFNWLAFISDNPSNPSADVSYYTDGGGTLPFTGFDSKSQTYASQIKSQARLTRTLASSYEMLFPDGSKNVFSQPDSVGGTSRRVFLTQVVDRYGNGVRISYDASFRVVGLTDAIGQVTTFSYQNTADPLKITKVTDPFGRFATLAYNGSGRLATIIDLSGVGQKGPPRVEIDSPRGPISTPGSSGLGGGDPVSSLRSVNTMSFSLWALDCGGIPVEAGVVP